MALFGARQIQRSIIVGVRSRSAPSR